MKLYAQMYSERPGRPSNKGGQKHIAVNFTEKSLVRYQVVFKGDTLLVTDEDDAVLLEHRYKGATRKGRCVCTAACGAGLGHNIPKD